MGVAIIKTQEPNVRVDDERLDKYMHIICLGGTLKLCSDKNY